MLHLALMSSENRAAHALGRTYPGGLPVFVTLMNRKAQQLGMADTKYVEPTGLSSRNQSSARDLAVLVKAAHEVPIIRELSTSPEYMVEVANRPVQFRNTNGLVKSPDWDIGLQKTGYITEAGRCLVMQAKMAGRQLIMVFLDSAGKYSRIGDAERVRRWITEDAGARRRAQAGRLAASPRASRGRAFSAAKAERRRDSGCRRPQAFQPGLLEPICRGRDRKPPRPACPGRRRSPQPCSARRARALRPSRAVPSWLTLASSLSSRPSSVMLLRVWPARPVRDA